MKKLVSILFVMMVFAVSFGKVTNERTLAIVRTGDVFKVIFANEDPLSVKVTIFDAQEKEIFKEELISTHGFSRPYNFSNLPKGDYKICVSSKDDEKTEKICYKDQEWAAHVAKLTTDDQKILVAVPKQGTSDFSIQIFDSNDHLVYDERQQPDSDYAKIFHLKNFEKGANIVLINHTTGESKTFEKP